MSDAPIHWDDVETREIARGDLRGRRQRLGAAAGTVRVGLSRYRMGPGERPMPVHAHADEEEILFVLSGSGVVTDGERAWAIGSGDTVVHPAGGAPHTFVAGPEGMEALMFSSGSDTALTWLPRPNVMWAGTRWLPLDGPNPFQAEAEAGPLVLPAPESDRPPNIVALTDAPLNRREAADVRSGRRYVAALAGATISGINHMTVDPGARQSVPHTHSVDEELFVILGGDGTLELSDQAAAVTSTAPVRRGHVVSRPAGTGISHSFIAGPEGMELLAYGPNSGADMCFYPRSQKIMFCGLGIVARIERLDYFDGEG